MMTKALEVPSQVENEARIFLLYGELDQAALQSSALSEASTEEIDEIEEISRVAMEISEDPPVFLTCI